MKKMIAPALLMISASATAQQYSGTVNDLNSIFNPPSEIQGSLCANYRNDGNEHSSQACRDGVSAARWMAEKYAQRAGQYLGCLDGFYQGVWDGYLAGKNPTSAMVNEARQYVAGAQMTSAIERGQDRAYSNAVTESANDIISRYRSVINLRAQGQQAMPDKTPDLRSIPEFSGFNDGYQHDIKSLNGVDFSVIEREGLIDANASFEDKLAAHKAYVLQGEYASDLCDNQKTIFGRRSLPQISLWDFFRARRQYDFEDYGWNNASWAWDVYDRDERTISQYQNYIRLEDLEKTVTIKTAIKEFKRDANGELIPLRDAEGNVLRNEQGHIQYEEIIVDYKLEQKRVKLSQDELNELRAIYQEGFLQAYSRYYARHYASLKYHEEGMAKYKVASMIGKLIGEDVAKNLAKKDAYNQQYKLVSKGAYDKKAKDLYLASFERLISTFEENPVVELNTIFLSGATNDGIIRAGEVLDLDFEVTNLGEVSAPVRIQVGNNRGVQADSEGFTFQPKALGVSNYSVKGIAKVSQGVSPRESIDVNVSVDNPGVLEDVLENLRVYKGQRFEVRDYAEINNVRASLDVLSGQIEVGVDLFNPSRIESPAFPHVKVVINELGLVIEKDLLKIGAGNKEKVFVNFNNIDPLKLIEKKSISGEVIVSLGSSRTLVEKKSFSLSIGQADQAYASYFNALATGAVSGGQNSSNAAKIIKMIDDSLSSDLSQYKIKWRRQSDVNSTIVGELQTLYKSAKASGLMSSSAQSMYDQLAKTLAKKVNNKGRTRVRGKKPFLKALQVFSPSLSLKKRSHR